MAVKPIDFQTFYWRHPVISLSTDHPEYDDYIRLASWLISIASLLLIILALWRAARDWKRRNPRATLPASFWPFILLACAALIVTGRLRVEHKRIQWSLQTGRFRLEDASRDFPTPFGGMNEVDETKRALIERRAKQYVARFGGDVHAIEEFGLTANNEASLQDEVEDGFETVEEFSSTGEKNSVESDVDAGDVSSHMTEEIPKSDESPLGRLEEKAFRMAKESVRAEGKRLPFLEPEDWPRKHRNTWEYMDMLFDDPARFFWTAQGFAGFMAWALYLVVESKRYGLPGHLHTAFVMLAGMVSLTMAQCLFFALLVVTPRKRKGNMYMPARFESFMAVLFHFGALYALAQFLQARVLEEAVSEDDKDVRLKLLHFLKAVIVVLSWPWSGHVVGPDRGTT